MKHENLDELYLCMDKKRDNVYLTKQKYHYQHMVAYFDKMCVDLIS
jgi:hypothetical protein